MNALCHQYCHAAEMRARNNRYGKDGLIHNIVKRNIIGYSTPQNLKNTIYYITINVQNIFKLATFIILTLQT